MAPFFYLLSEEEVRKILEFLMNSDANCLAATCRGLLKGVWTFKLLRGIILPSESSASGRFLDFRLQGICLETLAKHVPKRVYETIWQPILTRVANLAICFPRSIRRTTASTDCASKNVDEVVQSNSMPESYYNAEFEEPSLSSSWKESSDNNIGNVSYRCASSRLHHSNDGASIATSEAGSIRQCEKGQIKNDGERGSSSITLYSSIYPGGCCCCSWLQYEMDLLRNQQREFPCLEFHAYEIARAQRRSKGRKYRRRVGCCELRRVAVTLVGISCLLIEEDSLVARAFIRELMHAKTIENSHSKSTTSLCSVSRLNCDRFSLIDFQIAGVRSNCALKILQGDHPTMVNCKSFRILGGRVTNLLLEGTEQLYLSSSMPFESCPARSLKRRKHLCGLSTDVLSTLKSVTQLFCFRFAFGQLLLQLQRRENYAQIGEYTFDSSKQVAAEPLSLNSSEDAVDVGAAFQYHGMFPTVLESRCANFLKIFPNLEELMIDQVSLKGIAQLAACYSQPHLLDEQEHVFPLRAIFIYNIDWQSQILAHDVVRYHLRSLLTNPCLFLHKFGIGCYGWSIYNSWPRYGNVARSLWNGNEGEDEFVAKLDFAVESMEVREILFDSIWQSDALPFFWNKRSYYVYSKATDTTSGKKSLLPILAV